ncbi:MAG TPA: outer membrane beta-barrel protein [Acidiferrobacter sp.]|nr:outer membrane beta-barrel protein [Acidiferrobacter sp.]
MKPIKESVTTGKAKSALLVGLLCVSLPGLAAASSWYLGAGYGSAYSESADGNAYGIASQMVSPSIAYDTSYRALSLFGGYRFNRYVALELAYTDLGTYRLDALDQSNGATYSESNKVSAVSIAAIEYFPINRAFSIFWKLGLASATDSETCAANTFTCTPHSSIGITPVYGIGGSINLGPAASIRLEYDEYNNIGNAYWDYTAGSFSNVHVDALFRF